MTRRIRGGAIYVGRGGRRGGQLNRGRTATSLAGAVFNRSITLGWCNNLTSGPWLALCRGAGRTRCIGGWLRSVGG